MEDYFGIDTEAVWDTVRNNIPPFKKQIHTYIHTYILKVLKSEKASERGVKKRMSDASPITHHASRTSHPPNRRYPAMFKELGRMLN